MTAVSTAARGRLVVSIVATLCACSIHGFVHQGDGILHAAFDSSMSRAASLRQPFGVSNKEHDPLSSKPLTIGGEALSPPCCVSWEHGRVDCFIRGPKSTVLHMTKADGKHGEWIDIGGEVIGYVECVSRRKGFIDLVGQGKDNSLQWTSYNGNEWTKWTSLGGTIMEAPSCVVGVGNRVDCTGRRATNAVFFIRSLKEGEWSAIGTKAWAFHCPLKCLQRKDRQYNCWAPSPKNAFRNIWRFTAGSWGGGDLGRDPTPVTAQPSACGWNDGLRCDIFLLGMQNQMMHIWVLEYGGWQPFEDLGGVFESTPHCVSNNVNTIHCIGVGQKSSLYRKSFQDGKWSDWTEGWGSFLDGVYCLWTNEGEISCYARGFDKSVVEVVYTLK